MSQAAADFWSAGVAIFERVLSAAECNELRARVENLPRGAAGLRHLLSPFQSLATDERLMSITTELFGTPGVPFRITLFDKGPESNWRVVWHQDTSLPLEERVEGPGWGPWSMKEGVTYARAPARALNRVLALRVHLDASTLSNGPLRVLPATHRAGVLTEAEIAKAAGSVQPIDCVVQRGGVIAMHPLTIHSSRKIEDGQPRRVLHIEYAASLEIGDGLKLATT